MKAILTKNRILLGAIFLVHIGLAFYKLDHTAMWDDEASVVWFAKNYLKYGDIVGYDGNNLFSYRNGYLINDKLEYNNPPLDIYYAAFIIQYIGDDDITVRASFTIIGVIGLLIFLLCLKEFTGTDKKWFMYSAIILLLSVNYLMIERNSRYYSINFLFGAISLLATLKLLKVKKMTSIFLLIILQALFTYILFLSHFLAALCWWSMCLFILLVNKKIKINFKDKFTIVLAIVNTILFTIMVMYLLQNNVLNRPDLNNTDSIYLKYFKLTGWLFNDLNRCNVIPLWSILLFIYLFTFKRKALLPSFKLLVYSSIVFIGLTHILNPQSTSSSTYYDIRYIYIIFPLLYAMVGYLLKMLHEKTSFGKYISPILLLVYINTTAICYFPVSTPIRLLLPNYIIEKINPYPTAYSEAIKYIHINFNERKKIVTVPDFHNTVFLRYCGDKIQITNTLTEETTLNKDVIDSLNQNCLFMQRCQTDYMFLFGSYHKGFEQYASEVKKYKYVDTIPIFAAGVDISRPELYTHSFGPKKEFNKTNDALYIYHN